MRKEKPTEKKAKRWERTNVANLLKLAPGGGYYARVIVNGKQKWRSLKTKIFSVAKLRLADFEREERAKAKRGADAGAKIDGYKCGDLLALFLTEVSVSTETRDASKARIKTSAKALLKTWPDFADTDVRQITSARCREWAQLAQTKGTRFVPPGAKRKPANKSMSPSAFNKTLSVLRGVFALAIKHGLIYVDPSEDLTRMTPARKILALPATVQFNKLVEVIATSGACQARDCADLVMLLAHSGMRLGEAALLTWGSVDFDRETVRVTGTETKELKTLSSERDIPLFPGLKAHLLAMHAKAKSTAADRKVLKVFEAQKALTRACELVGVKRMTHHDLRHLFATRCIESGVDIPTVSRWLGHADGGALAMKTYGHLRQEHSKAQAARVVW
ncbi:tyrosine-type recombinase/integrase [Ereboglobus luteus]|uniref:Tyr recombinase domain-containing protein n=1 Tax=Ereboglobus luteus TaxID=1796921 RepID=A0A2U8E2H6_9BACT|nr:site-specific integrase [Ereboglobus luteus]AWI08732.1 hypothetical protein CKA38_05210 [Ereboglobus luteus]